MKLATSLILIFLTQVHLGWATESKSPSGHCAPDMRADGPGGSMENIPVRDQSQLPICFAEAAAEQLGAIQKRLGVKNYTEPSAMALAAGISAEAGANSFTQGGDPCAVLSYAKKNGICSSDAVENTNADPSGLLNQNLKQSISQGENLQQSYNPQSSFSQSNAADFRDSGVCSKPRPLSEVIRDIPDSALMNKLLNKFSNLDSTFKEITKNCSRVPPKVTIQNPFGEVDFSCNRFPGKNERGRKISPNEYLAKFNQLLDGDHPLPTIIGFCSDIMKAKKSRDSCGGHAALLIGRREVNGKCQFLLRNSWGTECDHYPPELQNQCEPGKGNIWVDADVLTKNTLELIPPPSL
jgi:hypothetical protein